MSDGISKCTNGWWKGSFPLWMVVMMLGTLGYLAQRELAAQDTFRDTTREALESFRVRLSVVESQLHQLSLSFDRLESMQHDLNDLMLTKAREIPRP